jgi:hypothetical protein
MLKRWLLAAAIAASTSVVAATDASVQTAYVDSVHNWGAWELDIEPAAGGVQAAELQPLNARSANVALRTNSFSALAPPLPQPEIITAAPQVPTPVTPPTVTPPTTGGPGGGPADGLF